MSGGGQTVATQQTLPDWAVPRSIEIMNRARDVSNQPYTSRIAPLSGDQNSAMTAIRNASNDPMNTGYSQDVGNTLRGYAAGNYLDITKAPGFQNALDRAAQAYSTGTAAQTAASFANAGAGPLGESSAYRETMGANNRAYGDSLQRLIGDQYNTQQGLQLQAASALPQYLQSQLIMPNALNQSGAIQQEQIQAMLSDAYDYPREQVDFLNNQFARALGNQATSTSPNPARGNRAAGALGGGLAGAGIATMIPALASTGWGLPLAAGAGALAGGLL